MREPLILIFVALLALSIAGCVSQPTQTRTTSQAYLTVEDLTGRTVEVPANIDRIVAVGPGALRLIAYLNASNLVAGVEDVETAWPEMGRPYRMAHPEYASLPVIGKGGPNPSPNAEAIVAVKPDVIFACYFTASQADALQKQTGIPVVVLSYGEFGSFKSEEIYNSLRLAGKILGREKRAEEVINYIESTFKDISKRVEGVEKEERPSVYVGALGLRGGHGIESTLCNFPPFTAVKAKNVACEKDVSGVFFIDKEKLLEWDPDIIFLDEGNLHLVLNDYQKNPDVYNSLKAFKNGRIYGILPFNYYTTNIEIVLADTYYIGKILYPERFAEIDPEKKADEIFEFFVGEKLYGELAKQYGGFRNISDIFKGK